METDDIMEFFLRYLKKNKGEELEAVKWAILFLWSALDNVMGEEALRKEAMDEENTRGDTKDG